MSNKQHKQNQQPREAQPAEVADGTVVESYDETLDGAQAIDNDPDVKPAPAEKPVVPPTPKTGFAIINQRIEAETKSEAVTRPKSEMHEILKSRYGIELSEVPLVIQGIINTLDDYVTKMGPTAFVTSQDSLAQQNRLVARINDALGATPDIGVVGMKVIEEYFRQYRRGAFGGSLPYRSFNEIAPKLQSYSHIVYAIQTIAEKGKEAALKDIDITHLKESCPSPEKQMVLLAYLNEA